MIKPEDFYTLEKPITAMKEEIDALLLAGEPGTKDKVALLRLQIEAEWAKIKPALKPSQIVQVARHPKRPLTLEYINALTTDFLEMHGDRRFADPALIAGLAFIKARPSPFWAIRKGAPRANASTGISAR
jgi:acetyl-CoA carboxylase carboxyl transferase subunit alpha